MVVEDKPVDQTHVLDDIPAFALGILEPEEALRVSSHLLTCSICQAEMKSYQEVVGELAVTLPLVTPPSRVKAAVLAQVRPTRHTPGLLERLRAWFLAPGAGLRLAAAALILVLASSNVLLWTQVNRLDQMRSHGYGSVLLKTTDTTVPATGMVVYTSDGKYGFLVVNGLPKLDEKQQYQLWLIKGQARTNGGVFSVEPDGYYVMEVESPLPLTTFDGFGITIEPSGGSPGPTGKRVLAGDF